MRARFTFIILKKVKSSNKRISLLVGATEMLSAADKITALYCRLSREDERLGESLSIEALCDL